MLVSAGFPRIAFDDDQNILLARGADGTRITPAIAKSAAVEKDPTWSADGKRVVYTSGQQLVSANMIERKRAPAPLRPASEKYADPSFAPIATKSVLAVGRISGADHDLCVGSVKLGKYNPQCIVDDSFSIGFAHWTPDGKTILAFAASAKGFGIVQYTSDRAFSTQKADWGKGKFVTTQEGDKGVWDLALSPDGKRLAAIANFDTPAPQLYLTTPDDIQLQKTKPLPVGACKLVWLDSRNLALVKLGEDCKQPVGEIVRINVDDPTKATPLATAGDNPTFQPLSAGG
jgi:Tol biopolymer transport system component